MIDDLDRNAARRGLVERSGCVAIECGPGVFVNLGFKSGFEGSIGVVGTKEIGMPHKEAFFVVVGVDEPAGDALSSVAADFTGVGMEDVHAVDLYLDLSVLGVEYVDIRLAKDDKEVALAGVFEVVGHVEVGVHAGLEDRDAAEFVELGGVGLVIEGAGKQNIESGVGGLADSLHEIGAGDGAEFRADEDGGAFFCAGVRSPSR